MPEEPLEPLSDFAATLLGAEQHRVGPPPDVEARLLARMASAGAGAAAGVASAKLASVLLGVALGGVAGAGTVAWYFQQKVDGLEARVRELEVARVAPPVEPQPEVVVPAPPEPPAPEPAPAAPPPVAALAPARRAPVALPPVPAEPAKPSPAPARDVLASENVLLERARTALLRGDAEAALEALAQHAAAHPSGQLAEEREALAVQALVSARRSTEAAERARHFRARYPDSVMLPAVEAALKSAP